MSERAVRPGDAQPAPSVAEAAASAEARWRHPNVALAVILICQLMIGLDATVVNIALPKIQADLGFSVTGLAWVFNAYTLAFGGLLLLGGRAGDILGKRRMFFAGVALFTFASLLGGLSPAAWWLVASRALQGVGGALASPNVLALIATNFPEGQRRNRALSVFAAVISSSLALGLIIGGLLTALASWRWVLLVNVPVGVAGLVLTPIFLQETARRSGRFDLAGAVTATAGLAGLAYAVIRISTSGWTDPVTWATFAAAIVLLALFVLVEMRAEQPIMPLRLFADRNRAAAFGSALLIPGTVFGVIYFLTQFLQNGLGYGPLRAGIAFLPMTIVIVGVVRVVPRLIKRFGTKPLLAIGAAFLGVALLWLTQLSASSGYGTNILGPLLIAGVGAGLATVSLSATILSGVAVQDSGAAAGMFQTLQWSSWSLGLAVLVTVYGSAVARLGGSPKSLAAVAGGTATVFGVAAALAALAVVVVLAFVRGTPRAK